MRKFQATIFGVSVCALCLRGSLTGVQLLPCAQAAGAERLTYLDLINRLTDLEHLAVLPAAGEKCAQWSSYDRRSKYDEASGKYVDWAANGDGNGIIRKEGDKLVFAEIEGPAVIWRIWSALANQGHVKIYLDGNGQPAAKMSRLRGRRWYTRLRGGGIAMFRFLSRNRAR